MSTCKYPIIDSNLFEYQIGPSLPRVRATIYGNWTGDPRS